MYFEYVKRLYAEIYNQVKSLFYKDNGPIIGIQIDNEYGHCHGLKGDEGRKHMMTLKKLAVDTGFDVPFYTATGWGGAIVVEGEFLPVMAAYVEGSWEQHIDKVPPNINFVFTSVRDDLTVGSDLADTKIYEPTYNMYDYPFATCELGGGMQATYQRRPIITVDDTEAMAFVKLGSGAAMLGYYMYHGGTNPLGQLSTLQESRETGSPNDLPKLSYDYQAPLNEYGLTNPSYKALRRLHLFVKSHEEMLAKSSCCIPNDRQIRPDDPSTLRYAVRYLDNTGFIFINNYQHNLEMEPQESLLFSVNVNGEEISFPAISLKPGQWRMLPFNLDLSGIMLKCSTMQPLSTIRHPESHYYFFYGEPGQEIEYHFDPRTVKEVISGNIEQDDAKLVISQQFANDCGILDPIILRNDLGIKVHIVTLTKEQASNFNLYQLNGETYALISDKDIFLDENQVQCLSVGIPEATVLAFPELPEGQIISKYITNEKVSIFSKYHITWNPVNPKVTLEQMGTTSEGHLRYRIMSDQDILNGCGDVFLNIDFEGDVAEITHNGELKADYFYNGLTWRIGLKRFAHIIHTGEWILDISPLYEDAYVYLDKWPEMVDGKALRLVKYEVLPEYRLFLK